jgi:FkbM family methyltransferase
MKNINVAETYYSQFGEDRILAEIFNQKTSGLCVEVGANDGVNDSNTMYFEKAGWNCILVEPNPVLCKMIRASRSSVLFELAASDKAGDVTLFVAEGAERAHGVSTINAGEDELNKIKSYGFTYREVKVQTKTLDEILSGLKPGSEIDFISVDVEGHELEVLSGFSLERWRPAVILVEDNSNFEDAAVSNYLSRFGYFCFKRTGVNDWYAHESNATLVNRLSRCRYNWLAFKGRVKNKIKKIPGVVKARNFLLNRSVK